MWKYTQSFRLTDVNQSFDGTRRSRDACGSILNLYFLRNLYKTRQSRICLIPPPDWEPGNIWNRTRCDSVQEGRHRLLFFLTERSLPPVLRCRKSVEGRRVGPLPAWVHSGARGGLPPGEAPSMNGWRPLLVQEMWYMQVPSGGPEILPPPHTLV